MSTAQPLPYRWWERGYPREWWRRPFLRKIAQADVVAPDGRKYSVRVVRLLWPGASGGPATSSVLDLVLLPAVLAGTRVVWSVRVLGEQAPLGARPLIYGQEFRNELDATARARAVAETLCRGLPL